MYEATSLGASSISLSGVVLSDANSNTLPVTVQEGSVLVEDAPVLGCMDDEACNYNSEANLDDGSCDYDSCAGCTDSEASNYDMDATIDDGSCSYEILQELVMNPYQMNYVSLNILPEDNSTSALLSGADLLIVSNDASDYYVPSFNVDQIGTLESDEAFSCFLNGGVDQTLYAQGLPIDISESITLESYMFNMMPFIPQ